MFPELFYFSLVSLTFSIKLAIVEFINSMLYLYAMNSAFTDLNY